MNAPKRKEGVVLEFIVLEVTPAKPTTLEFMAHRTINSEFIQTYGADNAVLMKRLYGKNGRLGGYTNGCGNDNIIPLLCC